jgi:hypothetical protein
MSAGWTVQGTCTKRWSVFWNGWECVEVRFKRGNHGEKEVEETWMQTPEAIAVKADAEQEKGTKRKPEEPEPEEDPVKPCAQKPCSLGPAAAK